MTTEFSHGYALFIGIGRSSYAPWSLPVTVKDAESLKGIFTDPNLCAYPNNDNHVRILHNECATHKAILDNLNWLKEQAAEDKESTIVVYYSGHGWLDSSTDLYYLIPHDVSPLDIQNSAISAEEFTCAIRAIEARRVLVIIDCCHAEGMATAKENISFAKLPSSFVQTIPTQKLINELKQGRGRAVFTSSSGEQKSWIRPDNSMSIYTYHLIDALKGAANRTDDRLVRLSNLMNYLNENVPKTALTLCGAEQVPFFDMASEDFAVAILGGGKGLSNITKITSRNLTSERKIVQGALEMARQSLAILEEQAAGFGKLYIPPHVRIDLEAKRLEVSELENRLNNLD